MFPTTLPSSQALMAKLKADEGGIEVQVMFGYRAILEVLSPVFPKFQLSELALSTEPNLYRM
jgi:hypothetical protein